MVTKRKPPKQNNEQGAPGKPARPSVKGKAVARPEVRPEAAAAASNDAAANAANQAGAQVAAPGKPKRRIAMPQSSTRLKQNQAANQAAPAQAGEAGAAQSARQPVSRPAGASGSQPARQPAAQPAGSSAPQPTRPSVSQPSRPSVAKRGTGKPTKARKPLNVPSVQPGGDGNAPASAPGESAATAEQASAAEGKGAALKRRLKRFSVAKAEKTASDQAKQVEGTVSEADAEQAKDAARAAIAGEAAKRRLERRQRMLKRTGEGEGADVAVQGAAEGDSAQGGEAGEGVQAGETARKLPFNLSELHLTWPIVAVLVAIAVVVVTVGSFSWGRWLRYDDAADFQGAWYANGTTSLVTVDGQEIHLTSDVAYGYTLDTGAKTITFTFGDLQGQGRYRFSADRSELVITDGDGFSFWGNLFSDIGWQFGQLITGLQGKEAPREEAVDGVTVLDRTPGEGAVAAPASSAPAQDADASSADDASSDAGTGEASDGETADGDAAGADATGDSADGSSGSGSQGFTGAVAEGGIESAGSNAVTLEQLKNGSLR
ncbi:hypothetical protein [uncultured Senegalimassilia sp.]|uniref:hypothetical protein n=1 Tax=uncultured Senegalimassilia sp. TaxID=1714350 RepID=UPI0025FD919C|nr:hypothetical protein [uncultured Senegalimassilia sp.]